MKDTAKILFSAVTRVGTTSIINDNRIYANGVFIHPSSADYSQISIKTDDSNCLFALSDGMEDEDTGISIINELMKFHKKSKTSTKNIHVKLDEMVQCVEQSSNLLHSISLGESDLKERRTAFAGLFIHEGSIAAVNLGSCRIYKLDGKTFRLVINDYKRAERLLKMGIINDEQAEMLSGQKKSSMEIGMSTVKKSDIDPIEEGQVYLLCSKGITEFVSEDTIYDILSSDTDPDEKASMLVAEAFFNDCQDSVTAMVIKIEDSEETDMLLPEYKSSPSRASKSRKVLSRKGNTSKHSAKSGVDVGGIASMVIFLLMLVAVVFGGFKLWSRIRAPEVIDAANQNGTTVSDTTDPVGTDDNDYSDDTSGQDADSDTSQDGAEGDDDNSVDNPPDDINQVGQEGTTYVVKSGDMLMKISKQFYGDESKYKLIMDANGITDPNMLQVGQVLKIPPLE